MLVETLETATSWSNLEALNERVTRALEGALAAPLVLCHVSHLYATGASLYFTALAAQDPGDPVGQWQRAKPRPPTRSSRPAARSPTTTRSAPTTRRGCRRRSGALGHDVLRVLKERCDPAGVMNPGKLLAG